MISFLLGVIFPIAFAVPLVGFAILSTRIGLDKTYFILGAATSLFIMFASAMILIKQNFGS